MAAKFMLLDNSTLHQPSDSYQSDLRHLQRKMQCIWLEQKVATQEHEPEEERKDVEFSFS